MNTLRVPFKKTQRGATLIIALLLLVMIAMYGIPAAMNSMQNERMTGNTRNRDLAFQATEHAIKAAETWLFAQTDATLNALAPANLPCTAVPDDADPTPGDGILPNGECHPNDAAYWQNTFDWAANAVTPTGTALGASLVATQPRYVVERMPNACTPSGALPTGNPPETCPTGGTPPDRIGHYYRITARGVGQDSNAVVILQTMYVFQAPSP
ncbi:MAG: PilX N-terminal domain-containing pilus assembly protein [Candidatus Contendobacter sp.]|nr:PilX N-terminal domain-containing pilus assembly protein [Candidatus Contendobacter sp.]